MTYETWRDVITEDMIYQSGRFTVKLVTINIVQKAFSYYM